MAACTLKEDGRRTIDASFQLHEGPPNKFEENLGYQGQKLSGGRDAENAWTEASAKTGTSPQKEVYVMRHVWE